MFLVHVPGGRMVSFFPYQIAQLFFDIRVTVGHGKKVGLPTQFDNLSPERYRPRAQNIYLSKERQGMFF